MSAFSLGGKTKVIFSKIGLILLVCVIVMAAFGSCSKNTEPDGNGMTATTKLSVSGLTSTEAQKLAWTKAKSAFDNSVLFRMVPAESDKSTVMKLSSDWLASDRSDAWYVWYADSNSVNWYMVGIIGDSISITDIGTRSFTAEAFDANLPKESTPVSMKEAAAAAKAQGANMETVTWVEYVCERFNSSAARLPLWVFTCSDTLTSGTTLNYKIYVNAVTGKVEGAQNDRNEEMQLPIDIDALGQTKTDTHEADLRTFFSYIPNDPIWAVRQLEYALSPNDKMAQMWLASFQSLKTLEIVSIEQTNLEQWTDRWESYKVVLNITTDEAVDQYGWVNGKNTRWITLVPQGAGEWKIAAFGTSP